MTHKRSLFSDPPKTAPASCPEYKNIRNADDERCKRVKEHCEDLWRDFEPYASEHFISEFRLHFHQRWFEMYLTVSFIRAGFDVKCPEAKQPGPDIRLALGGRHVWVEAVCSTPGEEGKPDTVPPLKHGKFEKTPMKEYVIRICNSLHEKAKKIKEYIEQGIIHREDLVVVAINVNKIQTLFPYMEDCMMEALYGIGDPVLTIDRESLKTVSIDHETIPTIRKSSGSCIELQPFLKGSMQHISLVLASSAKATFYLPRLGDDYVLYPNLSCTNRWPEGLIKLGDEWSFEKNESKSRWDGKKLKHTDTTQ